MPDQNQDADEKLKKLGHHIREGLSKELRDKEHSVQTIREAIREQWEKEQKERREAPTPPETLGRKKIVERQPEDPEPGR